MTSSTSSSLSNFFADVLRFAFIALLIVIPFRILIAQPFIVNGQSMAPTFDTGQYLIIDQISYRIGEPDRGDVIVFKFPQNPSKFFIKRVIGLPNETITLSPEGVLIQNDTYPEGWRLEEPYTTDPLSNSMKITLASNEYFVMGDNRSASSDSRSWGPLDEKLIQGRPIIRLFPVNKIDVMPGDHRE